jgi:hypothetical protein
LRRLVAVVRLAVIRLGLLLLVVATARAPWATLGWLLRRLVIVAWLVIRLGLLLLVVPAAKTSKASPRAATRGPALATPVPAAHVAAPPAPGLLGLLLLGLVVTLLLLARPVACTPKATPWVVPHAPPTPGLLLLLSWLGLGPHLQFGLLVAATS